MREPFRIYAVLWERVQGVVPDDFLSYLIVYQIEKQEVISHADSKIFNFWLSSCIITQEKAPESRESLTGTPVYVAIEKMGVASFFFTFFHFHRTIQLIPKNDFSRSIVRPSEPDS